ncbi:MAG: dipeptidase [Rhodothermales bacterium]|nr:dipeptidase [Rhodothermales bacterium]MBO6779318.1 dipeptidase [Rhodothermales bacterium]
MNPSCRVQSLALLALALVLTSCSGSENPESEDALVERARGIHERVITLDTHDDINVRNFTEERNYTMDLETQVTLPKMREGGLDVAWFIVYTGQGELSEEGYAAAYENAISKFDAIHWLAEEKAPEQIELAYTSDDVRRIAGEGKLVAMIGVENAYPVGTDLSRIEEFQERGARYMSLAHNGHSQLSDSNTGERDDVWLHNGLSDLGREAVAEMNRVGIMIDLSHPSKEANMETMRLSVAPVMASHSSARALSGVSRNMDDEQLMALKENGGVIHTVAFRSYVDSEKDRLYRLAADSVRAVVAEEMGIELIVERRALFTMPAADREAYMARVAPVMEAAEERMESVDAAPVDVSDFVDHIDYLVETIGVDHVGISSDFDGGGGVKGWNDASETFNVTLELVRRGYTEEEIGKLWSGNLLRVLDEVQAVAAELQGA